MQIDTFLLALEYVIYAARNPEFREEYIAQHREGNRAIARVIEERLTAGGDKPTVPPDVLAAVFSAVTNGVTLERLKDPDSISDETFGHLLAAVTDGFVIHTEDRAKPGKD
jgi:hypothetical protein